MNKLLIDLQLFAEGDTGTGDEGKGTDPKGDDQKGNEPNHAQKTKEEPSTDDKKKTGNDEKKYSDDEVNAIIDKRFAKWKKQEQDKVDEAKKLAEMNATEKAEYKAKQYEAELKDLKDKNAISEMTKQARKMLSDSEINASDELLAVLVSSDADTTKSTVDSFVTLFKDAVTKQVKDNLKGNSPKKGGTNTMTKEQILNVKDAVERKRLIAENIGLFQ